MGYDLDQPKTVQGESKTSAPSPQGSPALCVAKGRGPTLLLSRGVQHALLLVLQNSCKTLANFLIKCLQMCCSFLWQTGRAQHYFQAATNVHCYWCCKIVAKPGKCCGQMFANVLQFFVANRAGPNTTPERQPTCVGNSVAKLQQTKISKKMKYELHLWRHRDTK